MGCTAESILGDIDLVAWNIYSFDSSSVNCYLGKSELSLNIGV